MGWKGTEPMPEKDKKGKSFMDVYREVNERERAEELKRESELEAKRAEREKKAREEYAEKLRQERLELLKLKQGVISEEDIHIEKEVPKEYTIWEKISNFFYHNKAYVIFGTLIAALAVFLVYDLVTTVRPDTVVMIIALDNEFDYITDDIREVFEQYCEDYNGDGEVNVRVSYLPAKTTGDYYHDGDRTKLIGEFQAGDSIIVIGDEEACDILGIKEDVLADISSEFPDDENVTDLGYMLSGTDFAADIGYEDLADNLFIGFREPKEGFGTKLEKFRQNYDNAIDMWTNYLNGNIVNPKQEEE